MRSVVALVAFGLFAVVTPGTGPALAQQKTGGPCTPTRPDALGPFYVPNAPERAVTGKGLIVRGRVRSGEGCAPITGARIEWWSANGSGEYDDAHRAAQVTDGDGAYRYETDMPGIYPGRPRHLHLRVSAPGHRTLVTQIYPENGQSSIETDLVLVKGR
jgi:protocatechuate 3,4-dioxygenase beta subunit